MQDRSLHPERRPSGLPRAQPAPSTPRSKDRSKDRSSQPKAGGNLVLIGMRACGKSSIGRAVAERTGRPFVDLDDVVAQAAGVSCDVLLATEGEAAFRRHEARALREVAQLRDHVLATGGGAVLCGDAFDALAGPATVVYLQAPPALLVERAAARPRPALTSLPLGEEVAALLVARDPLYRAAADITISVEAADPILAVLESWDLAGPGTRP